MSEQANELRKLPERRFSYTRPELKLYHGLNEHFAQRLIDKSRQAGIPADDANRRFKDQQSIAAWRLNREVFLLADEQTQDLGGIIWYGPKDFPKAVPETRSNVLQPARPRHTFAIRLYEGYQQQALGHPFMRATFGDYMWQLYQKAELADYQGLWLKVSADNIPAIKLSRRFGYVDQPVVVNDDSDDIFMILSRQKSRQILSGA